MPFDDLGRSVTVELIADINEMLDTGDINVVD